MQIVLKLFTNFQKASKTEIPPEETDRQKPGQIFRHLKQKPMLRTNSSKNN